MQGTEFDEAAFFRSVAAGGARALLIGRRALVIPRVAARPKDLEDIRLLQVLQAEEER